MENLNKSKEELLELVNGLTKFLNTKSICKNLVYFHVLATNTFKTND